MSKRANNLPDANYPLVNVQRFQSLKCDVNTRQLEEPANYIGYVQSATGDKPTEGEVVGAALAELFKRIAVFKSGRTSPTNPMQAHIEQPSLARAMLLKLIRGSLSARILWPINSLWPLFLLRDARRTCQRLKLEDKTDG
jgi:hypothetical protein